MINKFQKLFFPLNIKNILLFGFVWLLSGFAAGTVTLSGPVRWLVNYGAANSWAESTEGLLVKFVIFIYVILSFFCALWFSRGIIRSELTHVKIGIPAILIVFSAGALFYWLNPQMFSSAAEKKGETVGRFTFGPYPTSQILDDIKLENYDGIISLLHPAVVPFEPKLLNDEKNNALARGLNIIHLPMLPWVSENKASLDSIRALAESGQGRYYVHCYLGKDRVGVVKRVVRRFGGTEAVRDVREKKSHRNIAEQKSFERGEIIQLEKDVFLTPYPTDEEFFAFILAGEINTVVSTLDSLNERDLPWIKKEQKVLAEFNIPFYNRSISALKYDPKKILEIANRVRSLPRPLVVHGFLARGTRWEGFIQAYRSNLPPLPPTAFAAKMKNGNVEVLAPHIAVGPRPTGPEFGSYLFRKGVRAFIYLGPATDKNAVADETITSGANLSWQAFNKSAKKLLQKLKIGGPYYLYGPNLMKIKPLLLADFPKTIPDTLLADFSVPAVDPNAAGIIEEVPDDLFGKIVLFFKRAIPDLFTLIMLSPVFLLYSVLAAAFAGWLRVQKNVRTPYTRKIFHLFIFTFASILQFTIGLSAVVLFGVLTSLAVLYAVYRGDDFPFYEAMARLTDQPHRSLFILIPLLTTALGGVVANLFFYQFAYIGYLVGGWGDAVGEPVGSRWGRHKYSVPSLAGVKATRSLEGSAAVILVSFIVAFIAFSVTGYTFSTALIVSLACAVAGAAIEAVSNHGLDNFTIQVVAAGMAYALLG